MPSLESHLEDVAAKVMRLDHADLSALAEVHTDLERLMQLSDEKASFASEVRSGVTGVGKRACKRLETLMLFEAQDPIVELASVFKDVAEVQAMIDAAVNGKPMPTSFAPAKDAAPAFAISPRAQAHAAPAFEPQIFTADDLPLLAEFVTEANAHLDAAEQHLLTIEEEPTHADAVNALFRAFHTIKGVAGFLNLVQVQGLAHSAESLLDQARSGKLQLIGRANELVMNATDVMKRLVASVDSAAQDGKALACEPRVSPLVEALDDYVDAVTYGRVPGGTPVRPQKPVEVESDEAATPAVRATTGDGTTKVSIERLDRLIDMVGELVIAQSMVGQDCKTYTAGNARLGRNVSQLGKIVRELQDLSMSMRMVQVGQVFRKMTRLVRDAARKLGKDVELVITGAETELDRNVVNQLADPLMHMVRNAVDHGLELPGDRETSGKGKTGRIEIKAYHKGGNIQIDITDDGKGLDRDRIYAKAVKTGVIREGQEMTDADVYKLIFHPGLSTAEKITDISGRGVGMDVVKKNIESLRGRIDITSAKGHGSTFTIRLPLTLAVIDGLVVRIGTQKFILPITSIERSLRPTRDQISTVQGRAEQVNVRDTMMPLIRLHELFNIEPRTQDPWEALVVIVHDNERRVCLLVDELLGQEQVVIKSLGKQLGEIDGISGGAVLGDGNVSLILDVPGIVALAMK